MNRGTTTFEDINSILSQPLPFPIPVDSFNAQRAVAYAKGSYRDSIHKMVVSSEDGKYCFDSPLSYLFSLAISKDWEYSPVSENANIAKYDLLIFEVLAALSLDLELSGFSSVRDHCDNNTTHASIKGTRPDLIISIKSLSLIKGEEKCTNNGTKKDARDDLIKKSGTYYDMFYGQIPFVFAYAAAGPDLDLIAISCSTGKSTTLFTYNLKRVDHRLDLMVKIINIARILRVYTTLVTCDFPFVLDTWTPHGDRCLLFFTCDSVIKKIRNIRNYPYAKLESLKKVGLESNKQFLYFSFLLFLF